MRLDLCPLRLSDSGMFLIIFFAGIANFFLTRAVLESGHPFIEDVRETMGAIVGEKFSIALDVVLLSLALIVVFRGGSFAGWLYLGYTGFNALAAWAILNRRL